MSNPIALSVAIKTARFARRLERFAGALHAIEAGLALKSKRRTILGGDRALARRYPYTASQLASVRQHWHLTFLELDTVARFATGHNLPLSSAAFCVVDKGGL